MIDPEWLKSIEELEALLLARKNLQVSLGIKKHLSRRPPREVLAPLAALARRSGYPYLALKILQPIFRLEGRLQRVNPTESESVVYGSSLIVVGAKSEGLKLLSAINADVQPDVLLFQANSYITEWRYEEAKVILEKYVLRSDLKPLQRLVGNLNLCSCYIVLNKPQKFKRMIREAYRLAIEAKAKHLHLSVVELEAQFYYSQNNYKKCQHIIKYNFPQGILSPKTIFEALLLKWDLLSLAKLSQDLVERAQIAERIADLAKICEQSQFWEVYRDCEFQYGLLTRNKQNVLRAYFGTPYKEYRKLLLKQIKGVFEVPETWLFEPTQSIKDEGVRQSLSRTNAMCGDIRIAEPYRRAWNLFFLLSQDLYRPISLGKIFNDLFPNEYFVKSQAAHRIQQFLIELRSIFLLNNIKIEIQVKRNSYQMILNHPIEYQQADRLFRSHQEYLMQDLMRKRQQNYLTAREVQTEYMISRTLALQVLTQMVSKKLMYKISRGRETIYCFVNSGKINLYSIGI